MEIRDTYIDFTEAFELYMAYSDTKSTLALEMKHEKKRFKELICLPQYGLCVYVIIDKFVVLRSDDIDIDEFVEAFILYFKVWGNYKTRRKDPVGQQTFK